MLKTILGQTIKKKRIAKGFSQDRLSDLADISLRYLQEIEAGSKSPSYQILFNMAEALDSSPGALLKPAWDARNKKSNFKKSK